jgi:uncharacterized Zn-finger protein
MTIKHPEILLVPEDTARVSCDGGGALGHPKVWYTFDGGKEVVCGYCDRLFTKTPQEGAKPYKNAA